MTPRVLAAGIGFTEGPLLTSDGRLLVVAMTRGLVVEIDLDGGVVGTTEVGGGPNGLAEGPDGTVWVAQNGGSLRSSRSARSARAGLQQVVGDDVRDVCVPGARAPNDLAVGPDGRIWFTDPGLPGDTGRLCALDPTDHVTTTVLDDLTFPNGLAFGPGGDVLHLADTDHGTVTRHRWVDDRLVADGRSADLPAGGPDGLALDADGRLYVAAPAADAVFVFAPDGRPDGVIDFPEPTFPTNLCFAGPALDLLVVTAAKGGRVLVVDRGIRTPGLAPAAGARTATRQDRQVLGARERSPGMSLGATTCTDTHGEPGLRDVPDGRAVASRRS
ncbi:SMP-30/gluconolactonase/LRE family protein [Actinomycetospora straminea]|uniref:SMP-30/gluconolactonase/LRE family protein n=1 Tax=Actinomycetospora straminea TaxID=663607 RepID=A0ABP9EJ02_9PSEU|nr:SMP-30/gluconolactonase/LRE family protein [Actinomycetospora straminea]MDD7933777.1 SMP-30/gluconolactonase/LRE family protein [Actinomycetospora straminea]